MRGRDVLDPRVGAGARRGAGTVLAVGADAVGAGAAGPGRADVVVVGASAGSVRVLCALVASLPPRLPAAVVVAVHVPATGSRVLASILDRAGPLPARVAVDGEVLARSAVLLAPPGRDLLVRASPSGPALRVSAGPAGSPTHERPRPGVDALLASASALGGRVLAVVLSGDGSDGAAGMAAVVAAGGRGLVQDPTGSLHASMPRAALAAGGPGVRAVPAARLGAAVAAAVAGPCLPLTHREAS